VTEHHGSDLTDDFRAAVAASYTLLRIWHLSAPWGCEEALMIMAHGAQPAFFYCLQSGMKQGFFPGPVIK
jgi:hypothetical protein